jgi:hypothetical protein
MDKIKLKVWNRLIQLKEHIATEVSSSTPSLRRWIAIYPNVGKDIVKSDYKFKVLDFELKKELVDEYFSEEDKINKKEFFVCSDEELYDTLNTIGVKPETFDVPWNCDYPL